jgi:Zn-ribbon protein, possibly nucleic acid-binding
LLAEIEEIKRTNKQKEEEILKLMEEIEKLTEEKNKIEEELNKITQIFDEENKKFEELCQRLKEEIAKLAEKRAQMAKKVSSGILRKYEMIRQKKGGIGIAPVDNGVCEGCHMAIPPQLYIEIQKDNRFHECPHCKRIIYFKRYYHQEASEEPNLKEAKASS